jgi:hypothetical protein
MKSRILAACATLALAACGQTTAPVEEAPAAPTGLMEQAQAMSESDRLVFGYQQLIAYQQAHPEVQPPCTAIRGTETRGVIPANVSQNSVYGPHVGSLAISVQCGVLVSRAAMDPREHWLVVLAPGATEAVVLNCAGPSNSDVCGYIITPAAPATAAPAPAAP